MVKPIIKYSILKFNKAFRFLGVFLLFLNIYSLTFSNEIFSSEFSYIPLYKSDTSFTIDVMNFSFIMENSDCDISNFFQNIEQVKNATTEKKLQPSDALWTVLHFENKGVDDLSKHIEFSLFADEILIFFMKGRSVSHKIHTGKSMAPPQKPFHSTKNYLPIYVPAGATTSIVIRQAVNNSLPIASLTSFEIHPSSKLINQRIITFTVQAFYLGLFIIMSITGIAKSFFHKRVQYTYFSFFILSLGLFFPFYYGLLDDLVFFTLHNNFIEVGELIFSGIVIFGFLFFSEYYQLKSKSPFHYWTYLSISLFSEISGHLMLFFIPSFEFLFHIRYFLSFLWLSATIYLTIRQIFKDQDKKYLLIGLIATMIIGIFVMAIGIFDPDFYDYYLYLIFQIAAFCFSAILFYDLFKWENIDLKKETNFIDASIMTNNGNINNEVHEELILDSKDELELLLETAKPSDKILLKKLYKTIETNIESSDFSVEKLAKEVGYSKVHLNRKIKAICNLSTNKFILFYRLNSAYKMLENRNYNVNEVAYKTGFSSTSYFVKCFGEKYGKTPGNILKV